MQTETYTSTHMHTHVPFALTAYMNTQCENAPAHPPCTPARASPPHSHSFRAVEKDEMKIHNVNVTLKGWRRVAQ
eukprot:1137916-Pelagomonas_calceolata.AAC.4